MNKALERAEAIKSSESMNLVKKSSPPPRAGSSNSMVLKGENNISPSSSSVDLDKPRMDDFDSGGSGSSGGGGGGNGGGSFSQDELNVLRNGSNINGRNYVPFFPHIDAKERFSFPIPFTYV